MTTVVQPGVPRRAGLLLAGAMTSTIAAILPTFLVGALAVQLRDDLGFDAALLGLAVGVPFLAASVTSIPLGRIGERVGATVALRTAVLVNAGVDLGLALAPTWGWLLPLLAVAGVANSLAQPAANLLLARAVEPGRLGLAFGVKQSGMPAATLLGGLAVPTVALTVGWRWAFVLAAGFSVVAAGLVPGGFGGQAPGDVRRRAGDAPVLPLVVLAVGVGFGAAAAGALAAFLVSGGVDAGLAPGVAGLTLTLGSAVGIAVRLWSGARADRRGGRHLPVVAGMLVGGAMAFWILATGRPAAYVGATALAFGAGWAWPGLFNLAVVRNNPNAPGAATGITQTGTYVGAVLGPLAFGALVDSRSFGVAWLVASTWYLLGAGAMLVGRSLLLRARDRAGAS